MVVIIIIIKLWTSFIIINIILSCFMKVTVMFGLFLHCLVKDICDTIQAVLQMSHPVGVLHICVFKTSMRHFVVLF